MAIGGVSIVREEFSQENVERMIGGDYLIVNDIKELATDVRVNSVTTLRRNNKNTIESIHRWKYLWGMGIDMGTEASKVFTSDSRHYEALNKRLMEAEL